MRRAQWIMLALASLLVLSGSVVEADDVPLPANLKITAPDSSIPAEIAAFSGKWVGIWDGKLSSALVVQKIYPADGNGRYKAEILYAWGTYIPWYIRASNREMDAEIKNGRLTAQYGSVFILYRFGSDPNALEGEYKTPSGSISTGTFKKATD